MPKCIKDPTRSYKGNEPSPKGRGFCAHAESEGTTMQGKNGKFWIVKQYANGKTKKKRWVLIRKQTTSKAQRYQTSLNRFQSSTRKSSRTMFDEKQNTHNVSNCEHFVVLQRKQPNFRLQNEWIGTLTKNNQFYEWKKYNCFSDKPRTLRKNVLQALKRKTLSRDTINNTYCGNKKRVDELALNTSLHNGCKKKIFIQHNGNWISLVCLKKNQASVFKIENEDQLIIEPEQHENDWLYTKLVFTCHYQKVFEASDTSLEYSEETTIDGPGHTVLLQNNEHQYTYIGAEIYQFETDDVIEKYYCAEISNWIPRPVAIGTQYVYFLLDHTRVPMKYMHNIDASKWYNAYSYYYGTEGSPSNKLQQYATHMNNIQRIK